MRQARSVLLLVLITAVVAKVVWWVVAPMIPYLIVTICLIWIFGFILLRRTRL